MNIDTIKVKIKESEGQVLHFRFNGARNQIEEFTGIIKGVYPKMFLISLNNNQKTKRTFTYSDILTSSLEVLDDKNSIKSKN
ncbi:MAG: Veg family protein [Bacilli bacterium]